MKEAESLIEAGRRYIQSTCCSLTNAQEISAPLAALIVERGSPFYRCVGFEKLFLRTFVEVLFEQSDLDVILSSDDRDKTFKPGSSYMDYIFRLQELKDVALMEFSQKLEKKASESGKTFLSHHAQNATHSLHKREKEVVLAVLGDHLPNVRMSRGEILLEEVRKFQKTIMVLFKPFRGSSDFVAESESVETMFKGWWRHEALQMRDGMLNIQMIIMNPDSLTGSVPMMMWREIVTAPKINMRSSQVHHQMTKMRPATCYQKMTRCMILQRSGLQRGILVL
ncbi:hypothetical protein JG687_00012328 [Phytophthora cactorum]|uniref:Uncharacterized protein n=1 Tax=Phytophthora cactorum TaxID=29920 RepID=A0A8T1U2B6_9STRA|nr:hypothetical protein JG687_00012328 [Phytophthora cactorum]